MFRRNLTEYISTVQAGEDYRLIAISPATIFLRELVEICCSLNHCSRRFTRKVNGEFNKDSEDSFQIIAIAAFALMMSHFETFQKAQFGELINTLDFLEGHDDLELAKLLEKEGCSVTIQHILAGRGDPREPGVILANSLPGWHDPDRVNQYFRIIFPETSFFSNAVVQELSVMWQLRHSVVHTAGVITREDATKVKGLHGLSDQRLVLGEEFIPTVARRFHIMVQDCVRRLEQQFRAKFIPIKDDPEALDDIVLEVVGVDSPRRSWFRK